MCDFTQYDKPSPAWQAVEKQLAIPAYDFAADPIGARTVVNTTREEASAAAMQHLRPHIRTADFAIPTRDGATIQARSYRSTSLPEDSLLPAFLYFHGGGFIFGTLDSEDAACASTALKTGVLVLNVNYRHTPEHVFPTAWLDAQDAFVWLHANSAALGIDARKVAVGGVSAGGQLSASLALEHHLGRTEALKGLPPIAAQVLIIPALAHPDTYAEGALKMIKSREVSSITTNADAPVLPMKTVHLFTSLLKIPGTPDLKDTKVNVLTAAAAASADEIKGMPPAMFGVAGKDPLRDEALLYAKLLAEAGVPTEVRLFEGMPHGHRRFGEALAESCAQWDRAIEDGVGYVRQRPEATGKFEVEVV